MAKTCWAEMAWNEEFSALGWRKGCEDADGKYNCIEMDVMIKRSIGAIVSGIVRVVEPADGWWNVEIEFPGYMERWCARPGDRKITSTFIMGDQAGFGGNVVSGDPLVSLRAFAEFAEDYVREADLVPLYSAYREVMRHF